MGLCMLWLSALTLLFPALISAYRVTGSEGETLVLPCTLPATRDTSAMCWGRGKCSTSGCNNPIIKVNGTTVTWRKSDRYQLKGDLKYGVVSLTITETTLDDAGIYCCRVRTPGLGFELKREITVGIQEPVMKDNHVKGSVGDTLTLPCTYSVNEGNHKMCWGKGSCGITSCGHKILSTDGSTVTWSQSGRYQLLGNITQGDVSLTITGVSKDEEGEYCCRVEIPGLANDLKKELKLEIQEVYLVRGSIRDKLTLPCSYSADGGPHPTCWGRGHCRLITCHNEILTTEDDKVTWRECDKYQLLENIAQGNVSLTISDASWDDGGVYCCRVKKPGVFNDLKKEIRVQIHDVDHVVGPVGATLTLPCKYSVSEGTTPVCWGRGSCPTSKCNNAIVLTDGDIVDWTESKRYELKGDIEDGDVSLTIKRVTKEDEGTYCCRAEIPGLFNDKMKEISIEVEDDGFQK